LHTDGTGNFGKTSDGSCLSARSPCGTLAAGLDILLSDPGLRSGMAAASLQIIGGHERHRWLAEWESLYGLLAATGAGERPR
jgi:hypothetical protein